MSPDRSASTRTLGVDFGLRRVGLAMSDPTGTIATPIETLHRRSGRRPPLKRMEEIARRHGVGHLVVGLPLGLDGHETPWCSEIRSVGERLAARLGVEVDYVDERFTSVQAERAVRASGLPKGERERKERVDAASAVLILQAWLDRRTR